MASFTSWSGPGISNKPNKGNGHSKNKNKRRNNQNEGGKLQAAIGTSRIEHLVVDAGALIRAEGPRLAQVANHLWTVPGVIDEVRDRSARRALLALPYF